MEPVSHCVELDLNGDVLEPIVVTAAPLPETPHVHSTITKNQIVDRRQIAYGIVRSRKLRAGRIVTLQSIVPDPQLLLEMQPEEVGGLILQMLHQGARANSVSAIEHTVNRHNFGLESTVQQYPQHLWPQLRRVLMEGWMWLENEGFLAHVPDQQGAWFFITRKGQQYRSAADLRMYRAVGRFPRSLLHPEIEARVWGDFVRGEYDTAVFKAFRDVEVAVRHAAKLPDGDIGVALMRKAFGDGALLEDAQLDKGEQQAMREFFAGAIGMFKNPQSHRHVALTEPEEAFEMLMIASHLRRIIDAKLAN